MLNLSETGDGDTDIKWTFGVEPKTLKLKLIGTPNGRAVMQQIADQYCRQLAEYAESTEISKGKTLQQ